MATNDSAPNVRFDDQAKYFDERAGLPAGVSAQVADAIVAIAALGASSRVLDVGAGTGEIGAELLRRGFGYVALDASAEMLGVFRVKARDAGLSPELIVADARARWPVDAASVDHVFGSRSLHWLAPEHVEQESLRVASRSGCAVLIGRVERRDESLRARLRRKMRELLRDEGYPGLRGESSSRAIIQRLLARGATPIPGRRAAVWVLTVTPRSIIDAWRRKTGLGGADVGAAQKDRILDQTEAWARETFGDIDVPIETEECYTLEGVMLAGPRSR